MGLQVSRGTCTDFCVGLSFCFVVVISRICARHRHRFNPVLSRTKVSDIHLRVRPCCRTLSRPPLQWMLIAVLLHIAGPALLAELRICDARAGRPAGLAFAATQRAEARDPYPRPSVDARFARVNATGGCSIASTFEESRPRLRIVRPLRWPPWPSLAGNLFLETFSNPHAKRPIF